MNRILGPGTRKDRLDCSIFQPGEYGKVANGVFYACVPDMPDMIANLGGHKVIEHEDGTITVSPSILITTKNGGNQIQWHGYLERGIWREV